MKRDVGERRGMIGKREKRDDRGRGWEKVENEENFFPATRALCTADRSSESVANLPPNHDGTKTYVSTW